jgi:hypothetical protein
MNSESEWKFDELNNPVKKMNQLADLPNGVITACIRR